MGKRNLEPLLVNWRVGDVITITAFDGELRGWRIVDVFLCEEEQESVVEMKPVGLKENTKRPIYVPLDLLQVALDGGVLRGVYSFPKDWSD